MKLKTIKPHYLEGVYRDKGYEYITDKVFGESMVRRGICKAIDLPKRKPKRLTKRPNTSSTFEVFTRKEKATKKRK